MVTKNPHSRYKLPMKSGRRKPLPKAGPHREIEFLIGAGNYTVRRETTTINRVHFREYRAYNDHLNPIDTANEGHLIELGFYCGSSLVIPSNDDNARFLVGRDYSQLEQAEQIELTSRLMGLKVRLYRLNQSYATQGLVGFDSAEIAPVLITDEKKFLIGAGENRLTVTDTTIAGVEFRHPDTYDQNWQHLGESERMHTLQVQFANGRFTRIPDSSHNANRLTSAFAYSIPTRSPQQQAELLQKLRDEPVKVYALDDKIFALELVNKPFNY